MYSSINSNYSGDSYGWIDIEKQIQNISKAGFTHIQWCHDWEGEYLYCPSEMLQIRDLLDQLGIKAHTVHASEGGIRLKKIKGKTVFVNRYRLTDIRKDYTSMNEYNRLAGVELLKNRIDLCTYIGASVMVLHMQLPYKMFEESSLDKEKYYTQVYKSFDELQSYAKVAGIRIALENLLCTPLHHQDEQFDRMFSRYDEQFLGFCYDSGHSVLMSRENYYYFLEKYLKRLYATHLHEADPLPKEMANDDLEIVKRDKHKIPFTGIINWDIVADYIAKSPLELPPDFEVLLRARTKEKEMKLLVECRKKAEKFYKMILRCKDQCSKYNTPSAS